MYIYEEYIKLSSSPCSIPQLINPYPLFSCKIILLFMTLFQIELTNDVQFLLPIMVSIMVAKWVGDFFTHPHYHSILELKCIPFLPPEPQVVIDKKLWVFFPLCFFQIMLFVRLCIDIYQENIARFHSSNLKQNLGI